MLGPRPAARQVLSHPQFGKNVWARGHAANWRFDFGFDIYRGNQQYRAMPFSKLGLSPAILEGVKAMGYVDPTPIQLRAIPLILEGRDVIGSAQTGTGKTAAFALPILSKMNSHQPQPRLLVLEPTRELAAQVETAIRDFARFTDLRVAVVFGGVGYGKQKDALKDGVDVLVATPGRLLDHLEQGTCRLDHVQHLVLDEADRMLDMGFLPDVRRILDRCPRKRHTALFSATIPPAIETLINWAMHDPATVEIGARRSPAESVKHVIYPVSDYQKTDLLLALLDSVNYESRRQHAQEKQSCRGGAAFQSHPKRAGTGVAGFS
jgi:ATP-dependent RNA helicase RhlE